MKYIKEPANRFTYKWYSRIYDKVCDVIYVQDGDSVCFLPDEMSSGILTSINRDNGELMPCTGFQDIKGIPIYEGYLLKNKDGIIDVVEWYYGNFIWNGQALSSFDGGYAGDIWAQESKEMEIVGNIYEDAGLLNPALVKGQMSLF